MELFLVRSRKSLEVLKKFNNKMDAKKHRNELVGEKALAEFKASLLTKEPIELDYIVSPGRDHDKAKSKSFTISRRTA